MWGTVQNSTLRIHRKSQNFPSNNCVLSITSFIYVIFLSHCIVARLSTSSQIDTFFSRADGHCYSFIYDYRFQEAKRKFRKHGKWTLFRLVCYVTILAGRQKRLMLCFFCVWKYEERSLSQTPECILLFPFSGEKITHAVSKHKLANEST